MGSLMAGWDSHVQDPKDVKFKRNKSLTKDEIEAFWKLKKEKEGEHFRDISLLSPRSQVNAIEEVIRSNQELDSSEKSLEQRIKKNGWWISSNWAFLNERPVMESEGSSKRYASQFHITNNKTRLST